MTDYQGAAYIPAADGNFGSGRGGQGAMLIIMHDIEGQADAAISRFRDPTQGVSAHYVLDSAGNVTQMVAEADTAYHCGNFAYNQRSVGIELPGYAAQAASWRNAIMLGAAARLVADICKRRGIAADRTHIIGHNEVPDPSDPHLFGGSSHHTDPGTFFPWDAFIRMVGAALLPPLPAAPPIVAQYARNPYKVAPAPWTYPALAGLAVDGYPLAAAAPERYGDGNTYTVQYFERAVLELRDGQVTRRLLGVAAWQARASK